MADEASTQPHRAMAPRAAQLARAEPAPKQKQQQLVKADEQDRQRRQQAREAHHHKTVWGKHPHGGAYYKLASPQQRAAAAAHASPVAAAQQADLQLSSCGVSAAGGWPGWLTAGYEAVNVGPTTNLVGDAMSQGAVDLVRQALRSGPDSLAAARPLETHWASLPPGGAAREGDAVTDEADAAVAGRRLERFRHVMSRLLHP